jgi:hypothetical protein
MNKINILLVIARSAATWQSSYKKSIFLINSPDGMVYFFVMGLKLILISFKGCTLIAKYKKRIYITGLRRRCAPRNDKQTIDYYEVFCVLQGT